MAVKLAPAIHRLDRLILRFRGGLAGFDSGKRLSGRYGTALEFADYRPYLPGDDPRRIDWHLYGRSHRLYTRLNRSEVDATVNFLIDSSGSMDWGDPHKGRRALELALCLAYISLRSYDRVAIGAGALEPDRYLPPQHGMGSLTRIWRFLEEQDFGGEGDLNTLQLSFFHQLRPRQMTIILSDFLSPGGYTAGLRCLLSARQQLLLFHLISPDELEPECRGPVSLIDTETGRTKEVEPDPYLLQRYRESLQRHRETVREFCRLRGAGYFLFDTRHNPVDFLLANAPSLFP